MVEKQKKKVENFVERKFVLIKENSDGTSGLCKIFSENILSQIF